MKILKIQQRRKISLLLFLLFLILSLYPHFSPSTTTIATNNYPNKLNIKIETDLSKVKELSNFYENAFDCKLNDWDALKYKYDKNNNGIEDNFELKINNLKSINSQIEIDKNKKSIARNNIVKTTLTGENDNFDVNLNDEVLIIIQFSDNNYETAISYFKDLGGEIISRYTLINGFAGKINYRSLLDYCNLLRNSKTSFLIKESCSSKSNLYYMSRNMNLRPYVWKNLTYTGDYWSSIAIVDTGIDDSHKLFSNGYGNADFTHKIVGWADNLSISKPAGYITTKTPIDDMGHGSHCAGIASGFGYSGTDTVTNYTVYLSFDYLGYYTYEGYTYLTLSKFNVTSPGYVKILCNFSDFTPLDDIDLYAYLYRGGILKDSYAVTDDDWQHELSYLASDTDVGEHSLELRINFIDNTGDGLVFDPALAFRGLIQFPFDPPLYNSGDPWKGVAPNTHLVGVKVLNSTGYGTDIELLDGLEWIHNYGDIYNITVVSMSLGFSTSLPNVITAVNNLVKIDGLVVVVAAGNEGAGGNNIGSPGDADYVITVAAMNNADRVTDYSSSGGSLPSGNIKPDIMAPGGSSNEYQVLSVDTNDNDLEGLYPDGKSNDLYQASGTSMATPAVAGAVNLLIEAMGGHKNWNYTAIEAKRVKALLLMTATETYGLQRETDTSFSPSLNRGGKDIHEGYGRINIDAAIEAWTNDLTNNKINISVWLNTSQYNPSGKHAYAGFVNFVKGKSYLFNVSVSTGADYDLYIYNYTSNKYGDPIMVASSTSAIEGQDEIINFTAGFTGKCFVVVKAIGKGLPSAPEEEEEEDDSVSETEVFNIIEFLTSPLGLVMIAGIIAIIVVVVIITIKSSKKEKYDIDYITRTPLE